MQVSPSPSPSFASPAPEAKATAPAPQKESQTQLARTTAGSTAITLSAEGRAASNNPLAVVAEFALNVAYLTEVALGFYGNNDPRTLTKEEYVEHYDVGALMAYIRDLVSDPSQTLDMWADSGGLDGAIEEGWRKLERWGERLKGPKMEYVEYVAGGAAVGYVLARLANALQG